MSSKNIKKRVNILMCATLLSTSALPVTPVFADDVSSVIEKTTSDKPANGVSDQAQQNESAISSTKIEETTMSSTATVSKENSHLEVQKKSSSSESSAPATSVIATDEAVQPTNIITDMWGTAPVSYNEVNGELTVYSGTIDNITGDNDNSTWYNISNSSIKKQDVTKIIISGDVKLPSNSGSLFSGFYFKKLVVIEGRFDTSNVTNMGAMFYDSKLTSLDVSQWNTSNVTNMRHMFQSINMEHLDVDNWDTSNVTNMVSLFEFSPISSINVSKWNTSNVTNMATAFFETNLTELDLTNWDTSKVQNYSGMLYCPGIKKLTLGYKTKLNREAMLPDIDLSSGIYTGRWERIDPVSPQSFYNRSNAFMSNYDGSFPGTYVWEKTKVKAADVTAKYLDESGKTISDNVILSGNIGDPYSTEQKAIPGYTFKEVQGSASGQFTDKEQTITYVYTKNSVTPVKPTEPGTTQTNENNTETPVKNTTNVSLHNNVSTLGSVSTTNEKSLPTTGEKPANWAVVVGGLITLTAATVLYLLKRKY